MSSTTSPRWILHVDMDAFFASVELLRHPELVGLPVVVGGDGPRGVVAAASYEARSYGVYSAMSSAKARRLCPDAVFLHGDHPHYGRISAQIMSVLSDITPLVEPLSLDEAFCDITGVPGAPDDLVAVGEQLRANIFSAVGLHCAVGIGPSKTVAKLASKAAKPPIGKPGAPRAAGKGVIVVEPARVLEFLHPLEVRALWGVGHATHKRLSELGVVTVGDLAALPRSMLELRFGVGAGSQLWSLANGIDDREVVVGRAAKSIGHEETYVRDLTSPGAWHTELLRLSDATAARLVEQDLVCRTIQLKVRYHDFATITRSVTLDRPTNSARVLAEQVDRLLAAEQSDRGIRLLGVSASNLEAADAQRQLAFDDLLDEAHLAADRVVDAIRGRFGPGAIAPVALVGDDGVRVRRRGDQQWGKASSDDPDEQRPRR